MLYFLFEVTVKPDHMDNYLALAAGLKEELSQCEGFVRSERFMGLVDERKLLSLSVWKDEASIESWRNVSQHRQAQKEGRDGAFERYTITVTSEIRRYTDKDRDEAPRDSNMYFAP